jgi:UDP:flavonoid glycosyltransferase YjiC (YdhE family)
MRVLFVGSPMVGHVLPLLPLATAFDNAGHDVVLATAGDGIAVGLSFGIDTRDVAPGFDLRETFTGPALQHPFLALREIQGRAGMGLVGHLFAAVFDRMADGVVALADEERPDLVIHEPLAATGSLAGARRGVPVVTVDASLFDARALLGATLARVGPLARQFGVEEFPPPAQMLFTAPPSVVRATPGRPLRYVPVTGGRLAPDELTGRGERPRIIVTRSTADDPRPDALMSSVVAAAAGTDLDVVLVRPDRRVLRRRLPPNVRTVDWVPFPVVFAAADAVVHHGGAGTLLTALSAGLPQLVVPGAGDRRVHAELIAARGAGLAIPAKQITAAALERLVGDPKLAATARDVAAEMAAMPAPAEVVEELAALVAARRR